MTYIRQDINSTSPQDLLKINENFMNIFEKVFGDINFSDTAQELQTKIMTQYLSVQGEGNFDSSYPLEIRFFVPPNVKSIKSSSFNIVTGCYRFDSGIIEDGGGYTSANISLDTGGVSGSITCSTPSITTTSSGTIPPLSLKIKIDENHNADTIISQQPHTHDMSHTHTFILANHTHTGTASISLPSHKHNQKEGVQVSTTTPKGVKFLINDKEASNVGDGIISKNNIDILEHIKIGEWNIIKITTNNFGNAVVYGTVELVMKN